MKELFDRGSLRALPLAERRNKLELAGLAVDIAAWETRLSPEARQDAERAAAEARAARARGAPVILAFGAHAIKNGLGPLFIDLLRRGELSHLATNGAGIIHDWEFAFQGRSGEDVRRYVAQGQFGIWEETGLYINLALAVGAWRGLGYGESVGALVLEDGLSIPRDEELAAAIRDGAALDAGRAAMEKAAAAADLRALLRELSLPAGFLGVEHPFKASCLSAAAREAGFPFTCHPMFGHDIIYAHPASRGAPVGRTADADFLSFAASVSRLEGGVYLSLGSAVMSPMIFEKALSMSRNAAHPEGRRIEDFSIHVVDLARSTWDWTRDGEPPQDDPAYYLRYCKTFSRMGGRMSYASADNRSWLVAFARSLRGD